MNCLLTAHKIFGESLYPANGLLNTRVFQLRMALMRDNCTLWFGIGKEWWKQVEGKIRAIWSHTANYRVLSDGMSKIFRYLALNTPKTASREFWSVVSLECANVICWSKTGCCVIKQCVTSFLWPSTQMTPKTSSPFPSPLQIKHLNSPLPVLDPMHNKFHPNIPLLAHILTRLLQSLSFGNYALKFWSYSGCEFLGGSSYLAQSCAAEFHRQKATNSEIVFI